MKSTRTCPKCSGKKFAVAAKFQLVQCDAAGTAPVAAITVETIGDHHTWPLRRGADDYGREAVGHFQTWICLSCGYTEFYAYGLADLERIASEWPAQLCIVDNEPGKQGPYR